jgi:hypothetical protein
VRHPYAGGVRPPCFDLLLHFPDTGRRKRTACGRPNHGQLMSRISGRLTSTGAAKGLSHPLGDRHLFMFCDPTQKSGITRG